MPCLRKWTKTKSGRIYANELQDALFNMGSFVSPMILNLLVSKYDKYGGIDKASEFLFSIDRAIEYDNFI